MATLVLTKVWLNLYATGEAVSAQSADRQWSDSMKVETVTYAGGRQRSISSAGIQSRLGFTLRLITLTDVERLVSWMGQTMQYRDHRGQRMYCVLRSVARSEYKADLAMYDAAVVAEAVTVADDDSTAGSAGSTGAGGPYDGSSLPYG